MNKLTKTQKYIFYFLRWVVIAVILGAVGGMTGSIFHHCIDAVTALRGSCAWLLYLMPIAGLFIVFLYQKAGFPKDPGTNYIFDSTQTDKEVPFRLLPLIFVSTVMTHLTGGSAGREGAALQVGGSLGSLLGKLMKLNAEDKHITVLCGMSAVFSAMFGTPVAAAIFSLEVVMVGAIQYAALVPCIVAAVTAKYVAGLFGSVDSVYAVTLSYELEPEMLTHVIVLGVLCGLVSMLFCEAMHRTAHFFSDRIPNPYLRAVLGGCLIIGLTLLSGSGDYNGSGTVLITRAFEEPVAWYAFLLKILFTAITIGTGYKGGEIVPALCVGAAFGCAVGPLLGIGSGLAAAISMIAVFCGVVNAPIASIFLGIEMFGTGEVMYLAVACAISYVCSGYYSLYSSQTIVQDKLFQHNIFKKAE